MQFAVLGIDGARPPLALGGLKDTVYVAPGTIVRLLMRFPQYADPDSPYMFHCHLLRHEDQGMMGQFVIVNRGQRAERPSSGHAWNHDR